MNDRVPKERLGTSGFNNVFLKTVSQTKEIRNTAYFKNGSKSVLEIF